MESIEKTTQIAEDNTDTIVEDTRIIRNVDMFDIAKESSSIKQVGYDKEYGNLYIKFIKREYVFFDTPISIYHAFLEDNSVEFSPGQFFHDRVKGMFEYKKIG